MILTNMANTNKLKLEYKIRNSMEKTIWRKLLGFDNFCILAFAPALFARL